LPGSFEVGQDANVRLRLSWVRFFLSDSSFRKSANCSFKYR
jgi:hypothetical protein